MYEFLRDGQPWICYSCMCEVMLSSLHAHDWLRRNCERQGNYGSARYLLPVMLQSSLHDDIVLGIPPYCVRELLLLGYEFEVFVFTISEHSPLYAQSTDSFHGGKYDVVVSLD